MTIRYAISIVSALHVGFRWSLRPPGCFFASPARIIREMVRLGYNGVQMIPVWGLHIKEASTKLILLSQGPWNAVRSLWAALRHKKGTLGVSSGPVDWVITPSPEVCQEMVDRMNDAGIRRVYHDLGEGPLVEVHPGLDRSVAEIVEICQQTGLRLVLDLHHIRRTYRDDEFENEETRELRQKLWPSPLWKDGTMEEWLSIVTALAPFTDVIHVQPTEGVDEFVSNPLGSDTGQLLQHALQEITKIEPDRELVLVAEYSPGIKRLLIPWLSRRLAKQMLEAMQTVTRHPR